MRNPTLDLPPSSLVSTSPQYCPVTPPSTPQACITFLSLRPSIHAIVTSTFPANVGWHAFGPGTQMSDALMFVVYPAANASSLVVAARSAPGHVPPTLDPLDQRLAVQSTARVDDLYVAEFLCRDCAPHEQREWIWAANHGEKMDGARAEPMALHHSFARFTITGALGSSILPGLPASRLSSGVADKPAHPGAREPKPAALVWHGAIMAVSFLLVYPAGALAIRYASASAFRVHLVAQAAGLGATLVGAWLALSVVLAHHSLLRIFTKLHHGLGSLVTLALLAQAVFGYIHHARFVQTGSRSRVSDWHVYLGRAVMLTGLGNTLYGAILARNIGGPVTLLLLGAVVLALWTAVWFILHRRRERQSSSGAGREQAYELVPKEAD